LIGIRNMLGMFGYGCALVNRGRVPKRLWQTPEADSRCGMMMVMGEALVATYAPRPEGRFS
jgi:hypothetical protein